MREWTGEGAMMYNKYHNYLIESQLVSWQHDLHPVTTWIFHYQNMGIN